MIISYIFWARNNKDIIDLAILLNSQDILNQEDDAANFLKFKLSVVLRLDFATWLKRA